MTMKLKLEVKAGYEIKGNSYFHDLGSGCKTNSNTGHIRKFSLDILSGKKKSHLNILTLLNVFKTILDIDVSVAHSSKSVVP